MEAVTNIIATGDVSPLLSMSALHNSGWGIAFPADGQAFLQIDHVATIALRAGRVSGEHYL